MIRWYEPIEAYHTDGRICSARRIDDETVWWTDGHMWHSNRIDGTTGFDGWRIRNVTTPTAPNTPAGYSDEVVGRAMALVERIAADWSYMDDGRLFGAEARQIVALNAPVDADLIEVRRIVAAALPTAAKESRTMNWDADLTSHMMDALRAELERQQSISAGEIWVDEVGLEATGLWIVKMDIDPLAIAQAAIAAYRNATGDDGK